MIIEISFSLKPLKFKKSYCQKKKRLHKRDDFPSNKGIPFCYWCSRELVVEGKEYCRTHRIRHGKRYKSCDINLFE